MSLSAAVWSAAGAASSPEAVSSAGSDVWVSAAVWSLAWSAAGSFLAAHAAIENTISAASSIAIHFFIVCSSILPGGCVAALFCYRGNTLPY